MDCCKRYEQQHPNSDKGQLITEMVNIIGVDVETIKNNQENSVEDNTLLKIQIVSYGINI
jgi:hypothetical protein